MNIDINNTDYNEDLELMEHIPRESYIEIYNIIEENMWRHCDIPSVGDLVDFLDGENNQTMNDITSFLENEDKLQELLEKENADYSNEESEEFISKVLSSNVTDISVSGALYKKMMASTDDVHIVKEDCGSEGKVFAVEDIDKETYEFKIKFSYINDIEHYAIERYDVFLEYVENLDYIHVRTPSRCENARERRLCKTCSGIVKSGEDNYYTPRNFGVFSTLMITEHATQASLDSMNKGESEDINKLLEQKLGDRKKIEWDLVLEEIDRLVDEIGDVGVQARFYEVALLSRFHYKGEGKYVASSFQYSMAHQQDALGRFIFSPTDKNFMSLVNKDEFEGNSIKTQIMFDEYNTGYDENE